MKRRNSTSKLISFRLARGWSQKDAARHFGLNVATIRRIESGQTRLPAHTTRIMELFKTSDHLADQVKGLKGELTEITALVLRVEETFADLKIAQKRAKNRSPQP